MRSMIILYWCIWCFTKPKLNRLIIIMQTNKLHNSTFIWTRAYGTVTCHCVTYLYYNTNKNSVVSQHIANNGYQSLKVHMSLCFCSSHPVLNCISGTKIGHIEIWRSDCHLGCQGILIHQCAYQILQLFRGRESMCTLCCSWWQSDNDINQNKTILNISGRWYKYIGEDI